MTGPALPDYAEALDRAMEAVVPLQDTMVVPLASAAGLVLVEPITADRDQPPYPRATMDGYALRADDLEHQGTYPVAAVVAAGDDPPRAVPAGACVAIATGAALPPGLDTVIEQERSDREDPVRLDTTGLTPGHAVHPRGSDARAGDMLLEPGMLLRPHHLGIAASVGATTLTVRTPPRIRILGSGDEVVQVEDDPHPHQVRDSNTIMVAALLQRMGGIVVETSHLPDEVAATDAAVAAALFGSDLLVTIGGIGPGARDRFPGAFERAGMRSLLAGAAIRPGRPVKVGRSPGGTVVLALPGNPVSALACAALFAWPILRRLSGIVPAPPWHAVELAATMQPDDRRRCFRPASLDDAGRAVVPSWSGSGDLAHTASTDGLLELPPGADPVPPGTPLRFLPWP